MSELVKIFIAVGLYLCCQFICSVVALCLLINILLLCVRIIFGDLVLVFVVFLSRSRCGVLFELILRLFRPKAEHHLLTEPTFITKTLSAYTHTHVIVLSWHGLQPRSPRIGFLVKEAGKSTVFISSVLSSLCFMVLVLPPFANYHQSRNNGGASGALFPRTVHVWAQNE
jgi:hypothetical protein